MRCVGEVGRAWFCVRLLAVMMSSRGAWSEVGGPRLPIRNGDLLVEFHQQDLPVATTPAAARCRETRDAIHGTGAIHWYGHFALHVPVWQPANMAMCGVPLSAC